MGYATVPLEREHRDQLLQLWKENMSDPRIGDVLPDRFRWFYEENPVPGSKTIVALDGPGGRLVGCGSAYARRVTIAHRQLRAGVPADFAVAKKHRIGGAAVGIQRALLGVGTDFALMYGFPNRSSQPVLQRVGYKPVASAHAWVKPLRAEYKLERHIGQPWLRAAIAAPVNTYLAAADLLRSFRRRGTATDILDRADARFDRLWNEARASYVIAAERTSEYLNWRYAAHRTIEYRFFCLMSADGSRLLGYVAYSMADRKVFIADVFALDMVDTADALIVAFGRAMRRAGGASIFISYAGSPAFGARLERLGYFAKGDQHRSLMVAFAADLPAEQQRLVLDPVSWYMFDGEMDI